MQKYIEREEQGVFKVTAVQKNLHFFLYIKKKVVYLQNSSHAKNLSFVLRMIGLRLRSWTGASANRNRPTEKTCQRSDRRYGEERILT